MFTLIHVFLPLWVFSIALTAFILLCLWLAGREQPHYWIYFLFRRNGNNVIGVVETTGDYVPVPDKAVDEYEQLIGFNVYEIDEERFKSLYKALSEKSVNPIGIGHTASVSEILCAIENGEQQYA